MFNIFNKKQRELPDHDIKFIKSPNYSSRKGTDISLIIIHWTGGTAKSAISWFKKKKSQVSAHYIISTKGEITQMVNNKNKAWHAGRSSLMGYNKSINKCSIGIELEGAPSSIDETEWKQEQLDACAWLCRRLKGKYSDIKVTDHSTVAPKRKVDVKKGTGVNKFPWKSFVKLTGVTEAKAV